MSYYERNCVEPNRRSGRELRVSIDDFWVPLQETVRTAVILGVKTTFEHFDQGVVRGEYNALTKYDFWRQIDPVSYELYHAILGKTEEHMRRGDGLDRLAPLLNSSGIAPEGRRFTTEYEYGADGEVKVRLVIEHCAY